VTNLGEVACLDRDGMANGNDGPFKDEAAYFGGEGKPGIEPGKKDADIIWVFDMRAELGVFPHNVTSSSVLLVGDRLFVNTSNGVDWSHVNIPSPRAPCLIALDKKTGELLGEEASDISRRLMHCSWSSPAFGRVGKQDQVIFGAGDGMCYGFDPTPSKPEGEEDEEDALPILKELWRADCNPPSYRKKGNIPIRYATPPGPSEIIATPVFHEGRVYVAIGQDPEHGQGVGSLVCLDPTKRGAQAYDQAIWSYQGLGRSISTVSVADGLVYVADYEGLLHCVDAKTGEALWTHDTMAHIWGSTLVADGRVYLGNEDGILTILAAGREKKVLREVEFEGAIYSSPIIANGTLYVATQTHLYAIGKKD
jgi:outer membrane protein assembly factor BamB